MENLSSSVSFCFHSCVHRDPTGTSVKRGRLIDCQWNCQKYRSWFPVYRWREWGRNVLFPLHRVSQREWMASLVSFSLWDVSSPDYISAVLTDAHRAEEEVVRSFVRSQWKSVRLFKWPLKVSLTLSLASNILPRLITIEVFVPDTIVEVLLLQLIDWQFISFEYGEKNKRDAHKNRPSLLFHFGSLLRTCLDRCETSAWRGRNDLL